MNDLEQQLRRPHVPAVNDGELTRESWKIFQIMAEFVEGYEKLASIPPSVSIFGSARTKFRHGLIQWFRQTLVKRAPSHQTT
jgi:hypothetical protein